MENKKYIKKLFIRVLICIVLFMSISIFVNYSDKNLLFFKKNFFDKTLNFSAINNLYRKYFGSPLPDSGALKVGKNNLNYSSHEKYHEGAKLIGINAVSPIKSGIVVFIGQKENFGNTVIIQGMDGIDYWYGNVEDVSVKLYDYIESNNVIANTKNKTLYVMFMKNGVVLDFEEYI